jgi:hypothetical protein
MRLIVDVQAHFQPSLHRKCNPTPHKRRRYMPFSHRQCIDNQYSLACNVILLSDDDRVVMDESLGRPPPLESAATDARLDPAI